jgi:hypothetical protein
VKHTICTYLVLTLAALAFAGCQKIDPSLGTPVSKSPALIEIPTTGPSTTPSGDPARQCATAPFLGTWVNNDNPSEIWIFRDDCTGRNVMCGQDFTFPSSLVGYSVLLTHTSSQLTTAECRPADGIYKSTRTVSWYLFSSILMQYAGNYHGGNYYTKQ